MIETLGIFGGTFDPPHIGHQILAAEAVHQLALDKVLWVLTPDPPHKQKQPITPVENRLEMVRAAIADSTTFELSRIEIDRPSPHFAVETVHLLQDQFPHAELIYLMGGDSLSDLPSWFASADFVASCYALGVMRRPDDCIDLDRLENQIPGITPKIRFIEAPLLDISASQIRSRIRLGYPYRYYLSPAVFAIIQRSNLYCLHKEQS